MAHILVAENRKELRNSLREILQGIGHKVTFVKSLDLVEVAVRENLDPSDQFQIFVCRKFLNVKNVLRCVWRVKAEMPEVKVLLIGGVRFRTQNFQNSSIDVALIDTSTDMEIASEILSLLEKPRHTMPA